MHRFWSPVLRPLAEALEPRVIVEIGVDRGAHTRRILRWAARRPAIVHAVDPEPRIDVAQWRARYGERLALHTRASLEALPAIGPVDLALIDGDHNWFTVFGELQVLERIAAEAGQAPPAVALHDVGWPYGRRDMYYRPEALPAAAVHPHGRLGMVPGRSTLLAQGGLNPHLENALVEGAPRSGVLTAVEDFVAQARRRWSVRTLPGFHGLGVLMPEEREGLPRVARALARLWSAEALAAHARAIESGRVAVLAGGRK
jgi:hypothetical protein